MRPDQTRRIAALNTQTRHHGAVDVLALAMQKIDRLTLVSSFGAESVILLHLVSVVNRDLPVLFIDTGMLFPETLAYQQDLTERLHLRAVRTVRAADLADDADGTLHQRDTNACCTLRKTLPLNMALRGFDGWITGRKRFQNGQRAALEFFEPDGPNRIKVNPLARWAPQDVRDYMEENRLPRHPLVARGYPSIGCAPCTSPVAPGEDPRSGRWRGQAKTECGIHFGANGKTELVTT